jgi:hypothetical protein
VPRIRTIKPEFFSHEELFDAEKETGLPLRLAFAGLWTVCDREGRFKWRVRAIKSQVMPYDDIDFSRVLDALTTRGFVVKYACERVEYGWVPGFARHQVINNRETPSVLPEPLDMPQNTDDSRVDDASGTRASRVGHAPSGEGKGREGKGKEGVPDSDEPNPPLASQKTSRAKPTADLPPIEGVDPGHWQDWIAARRKKNAGPITASVVTILTREATRAGISVNEAVLRCAGRGWINFDHTYGNPTPGSNPVAAGKQLTPMGWGKRTDLNGRN